MLTKLFGFLKPIRIEDAFFGPLLCMKGRNGVYWEGERKFDPLNKTIGVFVDTSSPQQTPTEAQREYFRWVEREYESICAIAEERFRADPWASQLMRRRFQDDFSLASLSIPLCRVGEEDWSLAFDCTTDDAHLFTVYLRGMTPQNVSVDG